MLFIKLSDNEIDFYFDSSVRAKFCTSSEPLRFKAIKYFTSSYGCRFCQQRKTIRIHLNAKARIAA
jgi:hypothetical protein